MSGDMKNGMFKDATFDGSGAKDIRDTNMNNTTARETPDHISGSNEMKEMDSGSVNMGKLGARGQAGG